MKFLNILSSAIIIKAEIKKRKFQFTSKQKKNINISLTNRKSKNIIYLSKFHLQIQNSQISRNRCLNIFAKLLNVFTIV
jgi:hypothetical protein